MNKESGIDRIETGDKKSLPSLEKRSKGFFPMNFKKGFIFKPSFLPFVPLFFNFVDKMQSANEREIVAPLPQKFVKKEIYL